VPWPTLKLKVVGTYAAAETADGLYAERKDPIGGVAAIEAVTVGAVLVGVLVVFFDCGGRNRRAAAIKTARTITASMRITGFVILFCNCFGVCCGALSPVSTGARCRLAWAV